MSYDPYEDKPRNRRPADRDDFDEPRRGRGAGARKDKPIGKVIGPAILLILTGLINLGSSAFFAFTSYHNANLTPAEKAEMAQVTRDIAKRMGQPVPTDAEMEATHTRNVVIYGVLTVVTLLATLFIFLGALSMFTFRIYPVALIGSVAAFLSPGCCCLVGLGAGIWGLIALTQADVKQAFR